MVLLISKIFQAIITRGFALVGRGRFAKRARCGNNFIPSGLIPGTVYGVRVRGVGGSTQYGPWSATVSLMCT